MKPFPCRHGRLALGLAAGLLLGWAPGAGAADLQENYPFAQVAMPELLLGIGTRIPAMGSAGAALTDNLASLFWNPAGLAAQDQMQLEFFHTSWIQSVTQETLLFGMPLGNGMGAVSFTYLGLGEIEKTEAASDGSVVRDGTTLSLSMYGVNFGYGMSTSWGLAFGGAGKLVAESLGDFSAMTLAVDAGLQWKLQEPEGIVLGVALANLGLPVQGYTLPMSASLGAAYRAVLAKGHRLDFSLGLEVPFPAPQQMLYHAGLEYGLLDMIFIRGGYVMSELASAGSGSGITAGLGFDLSGWRLGYTFAPQGELGTAHYISLGMDFAALTRHGAPAGGGAAEGPKSTRPVLQPQMAFTVGGESGGGAVAAAHNMSEGELAMRSLLKQSLSVGVEIRKGAIGAGAAQEVLLRVKRSAGPRVLKWTLVLYDTRGKAVKAFRGKGQPALIKWDTRDRQGKTVADVRKIRYRLNLYDVNNDKETAQGYLFAGNEAPGAKSTAEKTVHKKFGDILFDLGRAEVTPEASQKIAEAARYIQSNPRAKVMIEGFCDPVGEKDNALILSKSRAEAVARYLTAYHKISMTRILIKPRGTRSPVVRGNARAAYRNRRVEITITGGD